MKKTQNIELTEIGNSYIDKDVDFEEWRLIIAGEDSSNMSILDKEIGDLKKVIKKDGTGQKYLSDDGTYRYVSGGSGTSSLAFASDSYLVYTATSDTTKFTISNMSTSKSVELIKDNMVMMQGQEYDIDKSTGVVTLLYTLKSGEKIYYNVVEGEEKAILYSDNGTIEVNREKYLTDINGNFIAPKTTIAGVDGLSANITGMREQINDCLRMKNVLINTDINTVNDVGIYNLRGNNTNCPFDWCQLEVVAYNNGENQHGWVVAKRLTGINNGIFLRQEQYCLSHDGGITWTRTAWKEIATTTKGDIPFPFNDGYETAWANCSRIIKSSIKDCKLLITVKKTDGSSFSAGSYTLGVLPEGYKCKYNCSVNGATDSPMYMGSTASIYNDSVILDLNGSCQAIRFVLPYEGV